MHFTTSQCKLPWSNARSSRAARTLRGCRFKGERRAINGKEAGRKWETFQDPTIVALFAWILISSLRFWVNREKGYAHRLRYFIWKYRMTADALFMEILNVIGRVNDFGLICSHSPKFMKLDLNNFGLINLIINASRYFILTWLIV